MDKTTPNVKSLSKEDFSKTCRICLMQGPMASIFELKYEESLFYEILFELFSTEVNSEDEMPKNVCETCISEIIRFYDFKKVFVASEKILKAIITEESNRRIHQPILDDKDIILEDFANTITISENNLCKELIIIDEDLDINETYKSNDQELKLEDQIINISDSDEDNIQIDNIITDNIDTTDDSTESEDIKALEDLLSKTMNIDFKVQSQGNGVKKKKEPLQPKIITCSCQKTFTLRSEYVKHRNEVKHPPPRNHTCNICGKNFNKTSLKRHMRTHTKEKPYECKICSHRFSLPGNLNRHMMMHTGKKPHVCEFCGKGFIQGPTLTAHKRIHTGEKPYVCEFCGKGFIQVSNLTNHKRIHTGERPYLCHFCGKTFNNSLVYKQHLQTHNEDEASKGQTQQSRKCKICQKVLSSGASLHTHLLLHGEKKFLCNHCGKSYYSSAALLSHLRVHSDAKPYSCTICHRRFKHYAALKPHMCTHTGHTPYKCKFCSKAFKQRPHLICHLRTHTGEKPYTCPHCGKSFSHGANFQVHVRIHTGETPYVCDLCPMGFNHSTALKRHRKRHLEKLEVKGEAS